MACGENGGGGTCGNATYHPPRHITGDNGFRVYLQTTRIAIAWCGTRVCAPARGTASPWPVLTMRALHRTRGATPTFRILNASRLGSSTTCYGSSIVTVGRGDISSIA